eukprot:2620932-Rhodomonas_salina.1
MVTGMFEVRGVRGELLTGGGAESLRGDIAVEAGPSGPYSTVSVPQGYSVAPCQYHRATA